MWTQQSSLEKASKRYDLFTTDNLELDLDFGAGTFSDSKYFEGNIEEGGNVDIGPKSFAYLKRWLLQPRLFYGMVQWAYLKLMPATREHSL